MSVPTKTSQFICAIILLTCIFAAPGLAAPEPADKLSVFTKFTGIWGVKGEDGKPDCSKVPHTITFSLDKKEVYFNWLKPLEGLEEQTVYTILVHTDKIIRMKMHGETRKGPDGKLVEWDLIKSGQNKYAWHRSDWPNNHTTQHFLRCSEN